MMKHMKHKAAILVLWGGVFLTLTNPLSADGFTAATYMDLSVARLQLAKESWQRDRRSPSLEAAESLWARHGTTEAEFLAFPGEQREAVEAYLRAHPDKRAIIEALSAEIRALIAVGESGS